jgi:hypothetical protein
VADIHVLDAEEDEGVSGIDFVGGCCGVGECGAEDDQGENQFGAHVLSIKDAIEFRWEIVGEWTGRGQGARHNSDLRDC